MGADAGEAAQLRSRSSFNRNPQSGDIEDNVTSGEQKRRFSRLGKRKTCIIIAGVTLVILATIGLIIPVEDMSLVSIIIMQQISSSWLEKNGNIVLLFFLQGSMLI